MYEEKAIETIVKSLCDANAYQISRAYFDKSYQGRITNILPNDQYEVEIGGTKYTTYSGVGIVFRVNDGVWVTAPQNDFSSIYISGKRR